MKIYKQIFLILSFTLSQECPPLDTVLVTPLQNQLNLENINSWDELEIMTWNLKEFPINEEVTINYVQEIISDLLPDIINFQELTILDFNYLLSLLPAYDSINSQYSGFNYNLNLGMIYRKDCLELVDSEYLFESLDYQFGSRAPLKAQFVWTCGDSYIHFELINVHYKALGDGILDNDNPSDEEYRRYQSSIILSSYIDEQTNNNKKVIVAGDFNDWLTDIEVNNSLQPLIDNNNIYFTTSELSDISYIDNPNGLIDHILINSNIFSQNYPFESAILRIDDEIGYSNYINNISDHRPVLLEIAINPINAQGLVINEIMKFPTSGQLDKEWFEILNTSNIPIDIFGLVIRDNGSDYHFVNEHIIIDVNDYLIFGASSNINLNGGIEIDYEYDGFSLHNTYDELIIEYPSGLDIDSVAYVIYEGSLFPENIEGVSMMLMAPYLDNSEGSNWIASTQSMDNGDYGTPGFSNTNDNCISNGDVNFDEIINVVDVVLVLNFIFSITIPNNEQFCIADINDDGIINIIDIVLIIDIIFEV